MAIAPWTIPATFTTATEMSQYFLARNEGDAEAAAYEMEALLDADQELYEAMVDELVRIAVQERALESLAGWGQSAACREGRGEGSSLPLRERLC